MTQYDGDARSRTPRMPDPGWLPDPSRTDIERYWDGWAWTSRTRDSVSKLERVPYNPVSYAPVRPQRRSNLGRWMGALLLVVALYGGLGYMGKLPDGAPFADAITQKQPAGPVVAYPVFGSTDLVQYLARSMVAQLDAIDVSYWVVVGNMATADITDAMYEATSQNPYIYVDSWAVTSSAGTTRVAPNYAYAVDAAEGRRVATEAAVTQGLAKLGVTTATPTADAARAIHDYIASVATYDSVAFDEVTADANASSPRVEQSQEAYGILVAGSAVCNGYAKAFQAMAQAAGLQTVIVTGTADGLTTGLHAWNRVLVDGAWKTVDVTWDDGDEIAPTRYDYFLIDNNAPVLGTRTADLDWAVDSELADY